MRSIIPSLSIHFFLQLSLVFSQCGGCDEALFDNPPMNGQVPFISEIPIFENLIPSPPIRKRTSNKTPHVCPNKLEKSPPLQGQEHMLCLKKSKKTALEFTIIEDYQRPTDTHQPVQNTATNLVKKTFEPHKKKPKSSWSLFPKIW